MSRKLFCEICPAFYNISLAKEITKRKLQNFVSRETFARTLSTNKLPVLISEHSSGLIKRGKGIDETLQQNKVVNITLACRNMNGLVIRPGETFSFWGLVGPATKKRGYKDGRVLVRNELCASAGGGLCNLANSIHLLILHSPLDVTEIHFHSDALAPDHGKRIPMSAGTSVSYNYIDFRFKNNTDCIFQLFVWCGEDEQLHGELRSEKEFPYTYAIIEENHRYNLENGEYFRNSNIYRTTMDKQSGECLDKTLIRKNHSKVMYDYEEIPKDQIQ